MHLWFDDDVYDKNIQLHANRNHALDLLSRGVSFFRFLSFACITPAKCKYYFLFYFFLLALRTESAFFGYGPTLQTLLSFLNCAVLFSWSVRVKWHEISSNRLECVFLEKHIVASNGSRLPCNFSRHDLIGGTAQKRGSNTQYISGQVRVKKTLFDGRT